MKISKFLNVIILFFVLSLTVGFSAFVSEMSISNIVADIRAQKDVRITDAQLLEGDVIPNNLNYSVDSVIGDVIFNSTDSIATYKIQITNFGNVDVYFNGYAIEELSGANFECLDGCGEVVIPGLGNTVDVTFLLINDGNTSGSFKVNFDFKRIFNVSFEGLDFSNDVAYENDRYTKYIGSEYTKNNIRIYVDGVLIPSSSYEVDYGQLTIYDVTGDLVIESVKVDAKLMSGSLDTVGSEVCIGSECFYIIANDGTTVSMLAKYNLHVGNVYDGVNGTVPLENPTGIQSANARGLFRDDSNKAVFPFVGTVAFSYENSTSYSETNIKMYVDDYENYLENLGVTISNSRLMNLKEVYELCPGVSCSDTKYEWLLFTTFWLDYIKADNVYESWYLTNLGSYMAEFPFEDCYYGVRPVIEILEEDIVNPFEVKVVSGNVNTAGSEIAIGDEHFYVISSTDDSVTMLSKYNLYVGNMVDENMNVTPLSNPTGIQDSSARGLIFDSDGIPAYPWIGTVAYSTGDTTYSGSIIEGHVNNYVTYLEKLGVTVNSSRLLLREEARTSSVSGSENEFPEWIKLTSFWLGDYIGFGVLRITSGGSLLDEIPSVDDTFGVRPVITISKEYF